RAQAARALGTLTREAPNPRIALLQRADPFWRVVIAVVDQAELELGNSESCLQAVPQRLDVACFIARGHDNADQRGVGDHGRRIGGYPAVHGLDSRGPPPDTGQHVRFREEVSAQEYSCVGRCFVKEGVGNWLAEPDRAS